MKQNIYDDPAFFAGYAELRGNPFSANAVTEEPAMRALLPDDLRGQRVLDLGCGAGRLCRHIAVGGAVSVIGVDLSERMLALAAGEGDFGGVITYHHCAVEDWEAAPGSYDLVVSSLALHYVEDVRPVFANVARWLSPGGVFVFSV